MGTEFTTASLALFFRCVALQLRESLPVLDSPEGQHHFLRELEKLTNTQLRKQNVFPLDPRVNEEIEALLNALGDSLKMSTKR